MQILSREKTGFCANTEVWHVQSDHVDEVFRVCISGPDSKNASRAGAVIALDAPWMGGTLVNTLHCCAMSGELPPLYGVSIGYPLDADPDHSLRRTRDLTPTARPDLDRFFARRLGSDRIVPSGGAEVFMRFITDELIPALTSRFPIDARDLSLAGTSLGGLFTLYALLQNPASFRGYLAISPALWWDDRLLLRRAASCVASTPAPSAWLYLCAGDQEDREALRRHLDSLPTEIRGEIPQDLSNANMAGDLRDMERILNAWRGASFTIDTHLHAGETHNSVLGAALRRGLRMIVKSM